MKKVELMKIRYIKNFELFFCFNSHAEFFFNQDYAVLSSMKMYKALSENFELGVLISRKFDNKLFDIIEESFYSLMKISKSYRIDIVRYH